VAHEHIVVCDDDRDTVDFLDLVLAECGYRVHVAHDAGEVMQGFEKSTPACLVLDVHLPDHDGFWIANQLRRSGVQVPIVFITADTSPACHFAMGQVGGKVDVLIKPLYPYMLIEKVQIAVAHAYSSGMLKAVPGGGSQPGLQGI
jgi:DNA-binding response OmpR family regulator